MFSRPTISTVGSTWSRWDLHVHTPASIVQDYGGDNDKTWEKFLADLAALPTDFAVVGINDYWFVDGYARVREAHKQGQLPNIKTLLPVIELREPTVSGSKFKEINYHVLFSEDVPPEMIESEFISQLKIRSTLDDGHEFHQSLSKTNLRKFGESIRATTPEHQRGSLSNKSDLELGFDSLTVPIAEVKGVLANGALRGKYLIGLGYREWFSIPWGGSATPVKRSIVNGSDFVFTSVPEPEKWFEHVAKQKLNQVQHRVIDASDAHCFSTSEKKNRRLGSSQTWINAEPSFVGLQHALQEFDSRVFVGTVPPLLKSVDDDPSRYIRSISMSSDDSVVDLPTFDYSLTLNPGFTAIVGNKGHGKSALLDILALAGNASNRDDFAFLTPQRYLSPATREQASHINWTLEWRDGNVRTGTLSSPTSADSIERVNYLPQSYIENLCNPQTHDDVKAMSELVQSFAFDRIPIAERAEQHTLASLQELRSTKALGEIDSLLSRLSGEVNEYVRLADELTMHGPTSYDGRINEKQGERRVALDRQKDAGAALALYVAEHGEPTRDTTPLDRLKAESRKSLELGERIDRNIARADLDLATWRAQVEYLNVARSTFEQASAQLLATAQQLSPMRLRDNPLEFGNVEVFSDAIQSATNDFEEMSASLRTARATQSTTILRTTEELESAEKSFGDENAELARLRSRVQAATSSINAIEGDTESVDSLKWLEKQKEGAQRLPEQVESQLDILLATADEILSLRRSLLTTHAELFDSVNKLIRDNEITSQLEIEFVSNLVSSRSSSDILDRLHGRRNAALADEIEEQLAAVHGGASTFSENFAGLIRRLSFSRADSGAERRLISQAFSGGHEAVEFIVDLVDSSRLTISSEVASGGVPASKLSPGQRGLVLTILFLVVDPSRRPLLLDQPEENLDNATISNKLVPALKFAAARRQVILVTHNANLAVVGDADQVVICYRDKSKNFEVVSGALSSIDVSSDAVDILEGTIGAFDSRRARYSLFSLAAAPSA